MSGRIFNNKKDVVLVSVLSAVLIIPRILLYFILGHGLVGTDGQTRYIPQAQQLAQSFSDFFSQVGPLYSTVIMLFGNLTHDYVTGPVIIQHILGIITAWLVFSYFRKINLPLVVAVVLIVFAGLFSLFMEHYLLRESLAAFLMVSLVFLLTLAVKETKYMKYQWGIFSGLAGILVVLTRIELLVVVVLAPVVLFIAKKTAASGFRLRDTAFWKWTGSYFLPIAAVAIIAGIVSLTTPNKIAISSSYGSITTVPYYNLKPDAFNYQNSQYPELLKEYQAIQANSNDTRQTVTAITGATRHYLDRHPEINLSVGKLMDRMYFEGLKENTGTFLWSTAANFGNHLLGRGEAMFLTQTNIKFGNLVVVSDNTSVIGVTDANNQTDGAGKTGALWSLFNLVSRIYSAVMGSVYLVLSSAVFAWLLLPSLVFLIFKWKKLPAEIIVSFLICAVVFAMLTIIANPIHRFRYPADPLVYFLQLYLIFLMAKQLYLWSAPFIRDSLFMKTHRK